MKLLTILIPFLTIGATSAFADDSESKNNAPAKIDQLRGEIDYWTEYGQLESVKKTALEDKLGNMISNDDIARYKKASKKNSTGGGEGDAVSIQDFYALTMNLSQDDSGSNHQGEQEQILENSGTSSGEFEGSNKRIEQLQRQQDNFFKQVQDYLDNMGDEAKLNKKKEEESAVAAKIKPEDLVDTFNFKESKLSFESFSARIMSKTPANITIAFAVGVTGAEPAYITKKISSETKEFNIQFFGIKTIKARVLEINDRTVTLDINGKTIVAK